MQQWNYRVINIINVILQTTEIITKEMTMTNAPAEMQNKTKVNDHQYTGEFIAITLCIPLLGFILGAYFLTKSSPVDKKLGKQLIVVGAINILLGLIISRLARGHF